MTPSVLDGSSHILLVNIFIPKWLVCSHDFHMACPVPSFPYILINRSLLCNCHLESGLTYLLKFLGSCLPSNKFTMYFTRNSAFNHYMPTLAYPPWMCCPDSCWHMNMFLTYSSMTHLNPCCYPTAQILFCP